MAHLATVGLAQRQRRGRSCTPSWSSATLLADFDELWPERFNNKTNGVTPRRWLLYANPRLTAPASPRASARDWIDRDLRELRQLDAPRTTTGRSSRRCRRSSRPTSATWPVLVRRRTGVELPPDAMFVVQVKRIHEYKRQLLACLQVDRPLPASSSAIPDADVVPRAYIFAGKAAAGYAMAKLHIKLINDVAAVINGDPAVQRPAGRGVPAQLRRVAGPVRSSPPPTSRCRSPPRARRPRAPAT